MPPHGWAGYPNLRRRPHAPAASRGRLQRQIARVFAARNTVSSTEVYDWCFPRKRQLTQRHRYGVWLILATIADPVARASTRGRPWLWRLRDPAVQKAPVISTDRRNTF